MAAIDPELQDSLAAGGRSARTALIRVVPGVDPEGLLQRVQAETGLSPVQGSFQSDTDGFSLLAPPRFLLVLLQQPEVVAAEAMRRSGGVVAGK